MIFRYSTFIFFLIINFSVAFAQNGSLKFEHLTTADGLSQSSVVRIIQDSRGFMWFGTKDGLNKYDGYKFTIYKKDPDNPDGLNNNNIMDIIEDSRGNLWIATWGGGLNMFDREKEIFVHHMYNKDDKNSVSSDVINCLMEDSDGNIWIGTGTGSLNVYDPVNRKFSHYFYNKGDTTTVGDVDIKSLFEDSNKNIWVGTKSGGLNLFDKKLNQFTRFQYEEGNPNSIGHNYVRCIYEDKNKNLWLGTYGGGLNLFNQATGSFTRYKKEIGNPNSISHDVVYAINEDHEGNLWIGTEIKGINILNIKDGTFTHHVHNENDHTSLSNNSIYSIFKDIKGNMWIGTYSGGVNMMNIDGNKFNHYKHNSSPTSLSHNIVLCFYEDPDNNLYIGTDGGGVNKFNPNTGEFIHFLHEEGNRNSIAGNFILSVHQDQSKNLWIGTYGDGISVYNPKQKTYKHYKKNFKDSTSLSGNNAWVIYEDQKNNIWIGTYNDGLSLYHSETDSFSNYYHDPNDSSTLSNNKIHTILEDKAGNFWIGTNGGGLNLFDRESETFSHFVHDDHKNSLSDNMVNVIHEDESGNLWIGTNAGLNYFDTRTNTFTHYFERDGLANDIIFGIVQDEKRNLWISTNNGISKLNITTGTFKNYGVADGLQAKEFKKAFLKSRPGKIYFGGINGFNEFQPGNIKENISFEPNLVLTDFQIFNSAVPIKDGKNSSPLTKHINETEEITLSYLESVISFEFASLNYTELSRKRYSYILEGFDKNWNFIGTKNTATYTNLDPGEYTFKVKGLDNEEAWSDEVRSLKVIIKPPFWKTWWFNVLSGLVLIGIIISIFKLRLSVINKQKIDLEVQVKERTSELQLANSELEEQKEEILSQRIQIQEYYIDVKDSIRAARVIQKSILPSINKIKKHLPDIFILNKPKDIVSGDFYWFDVKDDQIIIAAVDCTGHGVSGAFMSINGHHLLNQAIYSENNLKASEILNRLNEGIIKEFTQTEEHEEILEGMDISLCIFDRKKNIIQYAGANNPLYILRDKKIIQIKPNNFAIGLSINGKVQQFTNHLIEVQKGDTFYIFSDGYADQIGKNGNKFLYTNFRELLIQSSAEGLDKQLIALEESFNNWKEDEEQLDDILVIGFRLPSLVDERPSPVGMNNDNFRMV